VPISDGYRRKEEDMGKILKKLAILLTILFFLPGSSVQAQREGLVVIHPSIYRVKDEFNLYYIGEESLGQEDFLYLYEDLIKRSLEDLNNTYAYKSLVIDSRGELRSTIERSGLYFIYDCSGYRDGKKNVNALFYLSHKKDGNIIYLKPDREEPEPKPDPENELIDLSFKKIWKGRKKDQALIRLSARVGNNYIDQRTIVLNEENKWEKTIKGLNKYYEGDLVFFKGQPLVYEVNEKIVDGYKSSIKKKGDIYLILNEEMTSPSPDKNGTRPPKTGDDFGSIFYIGLLGGLVLLVLLKVRGEKKS